MKQYWNPFVPPPNSPPPPCIQCPISSPSPPGLLLPGYDLLLLPPSHGLGLEGGGWGDLQVTLGLLVCPPPAVAGSFYPHSPHLCSPVQQNLTVEIVDPHHLHCLPVQAFTEATSYSH